MYTITEEIRLLDTGVLAVIGMQLLIVVLMLRRNGGSFFGKADQPEKETEHWLAALDRLDSQVCLIDRIGDVVDANAAWLEFEESVSSACDWKPTGNVLDLLNATKLYGEEESHDASRAILDVACGRLPEYCCNQRVRLANSTKSLGLSVKPLSSGGQVAAVIVQTDRTEDSEVRNSILVEKQRAETLADAMETSQLSLELAVKGGNLGLWHWDVNSGYFDVSTDWLATFGLENNLESDVEKFHELLHEEDTVLWTEADAASLAPDEPYDRQFRIRRGDGSFAWVQALGRSNGLLPDGSPESISGIMLDIDARKSAELHDASMANIIEESLNEVYVFDRQSWQYLEVNRGARENLDYSLHQLREMTPVEVLPEYEEAEFAGLLDELETSRREHVEVEALHERKNGTCYPVMLNLQKAHLVGREVYVAFVVDLTHRRELENQLSQAQKLESIGQLAAGVAHEMNTPLQYVSANIQYLNSCSDAIFEVIDAFRDSLDIDTEPADWHARHASLNDKMNDRRFEQIREELPKAIVDSKEGVDRVLKIVRAMKVFSHPGTEEKTPTDLNNSIRSTVTITENRWKFSSELVLDLDEDLDHVECDPGSINQVFVNLIVNAADAIADRVDSLEEPDFTRGRITVRTYRDGANAVIEVEDNGCGMPDSVRRRIFDPFYTTKDVGKGTGQGLTLSHSIVVQKHHGALNAISTVGEGTTMQVVLPFYASESKTKSEEQLAVLNR